VYDEVINGKKIVGCDPQGERYLCKCDGGDIFLWWTRNRELLPFQSCTINVSWGRHTPGREDIDTPQKRGILVKGRFAHSSLSLP
jgi:hypothetical protein